MEVMPHIRSPFAMKSASARDRNVFRYKGYDREHRGEGRPSGLPMAYPPDVSCPTAGCSFRVFQRKSPKSIPKTRSPNASMKVMAVIFFLR